MSSIKYKAQNVFEKSKSVVNSLASLKQEVKDLRSKLEKTEFESRLLGEINTALTSTFNLQEILPLIFQVMTTLVNTQGVSVVLIDEEDNTLRIAESYGLEPKDIQNFYIYYAQLDKNSIFKEVLDKRTLSFFGPEDGLAFPMLMITPLISRYKVIGFLNIHSMYQNRQLTPDKVALVKALSSQASIAISNAQLFNSMKEQATVDHCTGLFNFRHFQQKLDEEIRNAEQTGSSFTLLVLDIDFFKRVNDTYGHLYGDTVLREIAKIMKKYVHAEDTVCRYGGEEFAIILPNCSQEIALKIAERIRTKIEEITSNDRRGIFKSTITISIGVAEYQRGINKVTLIQRADSGLYYAKNTGRNKVCVYDPSLELEYERYLPKKQRG